MIEAVLIRIFIAQVLRWLLFENGLLRSFWNNFDNLPLAGYFLKCAFCQGFWLGFFIFFPSFGLLDAVVWGMMSAWLALSLQTRFAKNSKSEE